MVFFPRTLRPLSELIRLGLIRGAKGSRGIKLAAAIRLPPTVFGHATDMWDGQTALRGDDIKNARRRFRGWVTSPDAPPLGSFDHKAPSSLEHVGKRLDVFLDREGLWYRGRVVQYSSRTKKHMVRFDSGSIEGVDFATCRVRWLSPTADFLPAGQTDGQTTKKRKQARKPVKSSSKIETGVRDMQSAGASESTCQAMGSIAMSSGAAKLANAVLFDQIAPFAWQFNVSSLVMCMAMRQLFFIDVDNKNLVYVTSS
eukprot:scaffold268873_cov33-Prasinocladus_malaysianus.AAC.2